MPDNNQRNMIVFMVIALGLFAFYQFFVIGPQDKAAQAARQRAAASQPATVNAPGSAAASAYMPRAQAIAATPRVAIATPALTGSLSLTGGRIDDLYLNTYRETVDPKSPPVELFRPKAAEGAYYAQNGWTGANLGGLPTDDTLWTIKSGSTLTPTTPVVLGYDNGQGLVFTRQIAVDDKFLFTITDTVANQTTAAVTLTPYALIQRQLSDKVVPSVAFEGAVGALGEDKQTLRNKTWKTWRKEGDFGTPTKGGWLGLTDKYWLAALIPDQNQTVRGQFKALDANGFNANFVAPSQTVQPGAQIQEVTRIFAGAKVVPILRDYQKTLGVPRLDDAVDWGTGWGSWQWIIAKPMFLVLEQLYKLMGNLGLALLGLTVIVRLIFFYPANLSYGSMAKMKKVQPEIDALRVQFKDDPAGLQRETMAIYSQRKINPLMGCLPMLATIPVLIGLYKVLAVSIEMRHAPFYWLTNDLSAKDPTTLWNLFGLIPYHPAAIPFIGTVLDGPLHLGVWAIAYGFTTWLSQSMSPPAGDPTQQKMMQFMPVIFTFVLGSLAVGLLIYYTWSNCLTVLQQYVLMRKHGVDNPIDGIINRLKGKKAAT
jgi:YidC/Oxa1 family membrane protein insertase